MVAEFESQRTGAERVTGALKPGYSYYANNRQLVYLGAGEPGVTEQEFYAQEAHYRNIIQRHAGETGANYQTMYTQGPLNIIPAKDYTAPLFDPRKGIKSESSYNPIVVGEYHGYEVKDGLQQIPINITGAKEEVSSRATVQILPKVLTPKQVAEIEQKGFSLWQSGHSGVAGSHYGIVPLTKQDFNFRTGEKITLPQDNNIKLWNFGKTTGTSFALSDIFPMQDRTRYYFGTSSTPVGLSRAEIKLTREQYGEGGVSSVYTQARVESIINPLFEGIGNIKFYPTPATANFGGVFQPPSMEQVRINIGEGSKSYITTIPIFAAGVVGSVGQGPAAQRMFIEGTKNFYVELARGRPSAIGSLLAFETLGFGIGKTTNFIKPKAKPIESFSRPELDITKTYPEMPAEVIGGEGGKIQAFKGNILKAEEVQVGEKISNRAVVQKGGLTGFLVLEDTILKLGRREIPLTKGQAVISFAGETAITKLKLRSPLSQLLSGGEKYSLAGIDVKPFKQISIINVPVKEQGQVMYTLLNRKYFGKLEPFPNLWGDQFGAGAQRAFGTKTGATVINVGQVGGERVVVVGKGQTLATTPLLEKTLTKNFFDLRLTSFGKQNRFSQRSLSIIKPISFTEQGLRIEPGRIKILLKEYNQPRSLHLIEKGGRLQIPTGTKEQYSVGRFLGVGEKGNVVYARTRVKTTLSELNRLKLNTPLLERTPLEPGKRSNVLIKAMQKKGPVLTGENAVFDITSQAVEAGEKQLQFLSREETQNFIKIADKSTQLQESKTKAETTRILQLPEIVTPKEGTTLTPIGMSLSRLKTLTNTSDKTTGIERIKLVPRSMDITTKGTIVAPTKTDFINKIDLTSKTGIIPITKIPVVSREAIATATKISMVELTKTTPLTKLRLPGGRFAPQPPVFGGGGEEIKIYFYGSDEKKKLFRKKERPFRLPKEKPSKRILTPFADLLSYTRAQIQTGKPVLHPSESTARRWFKKTLGFRIPVAKQGGGK